MVVPALESCENQINLCPLKKDISLKNTRYVYKHHFLGMKSTSYWYLVSTTFHWLGRSQLLVLVASPKAASTFDLEKHHFLFPWTLVCGSKTCPVMEIFKSTTKEGPRKREHTPGRWKVMAADGKSWRLIAQLCVSQSVKYRFQVLHYLETQHGVRGHLHPEPKPLSFAQF